MKTFLTLFVLFFSSSVFAGDDLTGKSIICGYGSHSSKPDIRGFDFLPNNKVNYYYYYNEDNKIKLANDSFKRDYKYKTTFSKIKIDYDDDYSHYEIDRKYLHVMYIGNSSTNDKLIFNGSMCNIFIRGSILDNLDIILKKIINKIQQDNKI